MSRRRRVNTFSLLSISFSRRNLRRICSSPLKAFTTRMPVRVSSTVLNRSAAFCCARRPSLRRLLPIRPISSPLNGSSSSAMSVSFQEMPIMSASDSTMVMGSRNTISM